MNSQETLKQYTYLGDRSTSIEWVNKVCVAYLNSNGKCVRGRNGAMLVWFNNKPVVVLGRRLRKLSFPD